MSERKEYLGDGVYADIDPARSVILTTEDGIHVTNEIVLERPVALKLVDFITRHQTLLR